MNIESNNMNFGIFCSLRRRVEENAYNEFDLGLQYKNIETLVQLYKHNDGE